MTVFDTTLRDGEQTPGVSFSTEQKHSIAAQLSALGVHTIEAGFPASSAGERESVRAIAALDLDAEICGLARALKSDVDACLDCDVDLIHVFIPTSDIQRVHTIKKTREEVLASTSAIIEYVREHHGQCMFSPMDATRTEPAYLLEVCRAAAAAGATIINLPDTVGVASPTSMATMVRGIAPEVDAIIDVHCHNDFGLAVANTTMAVEAGARQVQVTVNGIGERAGNADLAQTVMVLESIYGIKTGIKTEKIVETSTLVSRYSGIPLPPMQPVVGENAFSHESGIHSQGVLANSATFEPGIMTPEMVGHRRRLMLGKHVGRHAVRQMLLDAHLEVTDQQLNLVVEKVKAIADKGKRITDSDLYAIGEGVLGIEEGPRAMDLADIAIMTGNHMIPTASVRAIWQGEERVVSSVGNGPVDAALNAIGKILPAEVRLKDFRIEAISGGSDAICHVTIAVEDQKGRIVDAGASGDDVVITSTEAMVNAINLLYRF
ncbi:2-isopropylmalate synthase [Methanosphaerula subterraneus]|uniref:2-isopropylmalate synthase n=1 Tax=Methanosphaerula subterraneus TaxID=3350244 RepID=UPI003F82CC54